MSEAQVSELDCVGLCLSIYSNPDPKQWDHLWPKTFGYFGHKRIGDTDLIVGRGSEDPLDWLRDLEATTTVFRGIGRVHTGFLSGVLVNYDEILAACGPKIVVVGHSLGASEGAILAGLLTTDGKPPQHVYLYGCPRPGMQRLADVLAPVPITSRKNLNDPVTAVPLDIPLLDPFEHVRAQIQMSVQPDEGDDGLFREHHAKLYYAGVKALAQEPVR